MTSAMQLPLSGGNFDLAIIAATISILLGGILFGVGMGFSIRRIRILGAEEMGQGIISAAMVGALAAFAALLNITVASLVPPSSLPACPGIENPSASAFGFYSCNLQALSTSLSGLSSSLAHSAGITGFASSLEVSVGVVSAQPFFALESATRQLSDAAHAAQALSSLSFFELEMNSIISSSALAVFLPAGLILRSFFATRKLGAAAMGIAIAACVVYPLLFLYSFTISKSISAADEATGSVFAFNAQFSSLPLLDLDRTSAVRDEINSMSQGDFGGRVQPLFPASYRAISLAASDLIIFPLISLIVSAVAALELYRMLSAPIFLPYFEAV